MKLLPDPPRTRAATLKELKDAQAQLAALNEALMALDERVAALEKRGRK